MRKLYKLKCTLYINEDTGEISNIKEENYIDVLFARKGEIAERVDLKEDDWVCDCYGFLHKYIYRFRNGDKYVCGGGSTLGGFIGGDEWFEEVIK